MKITFAAGLALVLTMSAAASGQTLGDVARKEEERRKAVKAPAKVYTNDNLKPDTSSAAPPAAAASPTPAAADATKPAASDATKPATTPAATDAQAKDQTYWTKRMAAARDTLDRAKTFADALQVQINSLNADFTSHDDPAQRAVIGKNRDNALAQLARLQKEITDDTKEIATVQEDARKAGVPAAWVR